MILKTERLILRPWQANDAENLYYYAKDERIGPIAGWPPHNSVAESADIIRDVFSHDEIYAVALKKNNQAVGCIGLLIGKNSHFPISENEAEVAYWIGVPYWGQGLIPEALHELMRHAFDDLKLKALWCGYFAENHKSKRAQEKCGFRHNRIEKNIYCDLIEETKTQYISYISRTDWLQQNLV